MSKYSSGPLPFLSNAYWKMPFVSYTTILGSRKSPIKILSPFAITLLMWEIKASSTFSSFKYWIESTSDEMNSFLAGRKDMVWSTFVCGMSDLQDAAKNRIRIIDNFLITIRINHVLIFHCSHLNGIQSMVCYLLISGSHT